MSGMGTVVQERLRGAMGDVCGMPDGDSPMGEVGTRSGERGTEEYSAGCLPVPLPELLRGDGRVSEVARAGLTGFELAAWGAFRWAVLRVTSGERARTRAWVADQLRIAEKTLEDWISPLGNTTPKLAAAWVLFGVVLAPADRALVGRYLAWTLNLECVGHAPGAGPGQAKDLGHVHPVHVQALRISADLGRVHEELVAAEEGASESGRKISPGEAAHMLVHIGELHSDVGELLVCLRAIAAGKKAVRG